MNADYQDLILRVLLVDPGAAQYLLGIPDASEAYKNKISFNPGRLLAICFVFKHTETPSLELDSHNYWQKLWSVLWEVPEITDEVVSIKTKALILRVLSLDPEAARYMLEWALQGKPILDSEADAVPFFFDWSKTEQGFDYWLDLAVELS